MLSTWKNCCSKWVPTPFSCQNKEIFGPTRALENGPRYQNTGFFEKMVKWVAYGTIGALLPIRMTNFSNSSGNATEKIKRKRWKQNKKCLHKCNYFLLLAGNLKCSCYLLLARKSVIWDGYKTIVGTNDGQLCIEGGNCWFWLFIVTQEKFLLVKCLKKVEA